MVIQGKRIYLCTVAKTQRWISSKRRSFRFFIQSAHKILACLIVISTFRKQKRAQQE
jgi:hypothetical protein